MEMKKKAVHMTTVHHPYDPRIYHKQCKSLKNAGFDVTLIARRDPKGNESGKAINHVRLKTYKSRLKRMIFGTYDAYRKAKAINADVYTFHDPELLPAAWLLKRKDNVVIYDIHEDYITSIMQKDYLSPFAKRVAASGYRQIEKFFTRDMGISLAEKYYKDTYPEGVWILNYPTVNKSFIEHAPAGEREDRLLYTGNVSHVRGALQHAKIPVIDPSIHVHFVGKCPGSLADEMKAVAGDCSDRLNIEGIDSFVEKEVIEERYLERNWLAGIALFPQTEHYRQKELTKFFEYMNAGLPILCSDFPVWKRFVERHQCGIAVDPEDDEAIRAALDYLKHNPEEAALMGQNGKAAVMEELNWQAEERKLVRWYKALLNMDAPSNRKKEILADESGS
ncbi:glycosyltransferase [Salinicoccus roseus]|uniref:glycosyltransferase n=1 Tax=Salinicoccus roseus TaxID=45670 RepID=UPI002301514F|nr:glycosyltransferase [Salinicoccus roseus]